MFNFYIAALGAASLQQLCRYRPYVQTRRHPVESARHTSADGAAALLGELGFEVEMTIPNFADASGSWKSFIDIAASVWGPSRPRASRTTSTGRTAPRTADAPASSGVCR